MRTEIVALACTASDGSPALVSYEVEVSQEDYDMGYHYDKAYELALDDRYEKPFVPFDMAEHGDLFHGVNELKQKLRTMTKI